MPYPSTVQTFANPGPTTKRDDAGFELDVLVSSLGDTLEAVERRLGTGSLTQPPSTPGVLRANGSGASEWGQVATADIASGAVSLLRLDYTASSNLLNATSLPSGTPVQVLANQSFAVGSALSLVQVSVNASMLATATGTTINYALYAVLDDVTSIAMLAQQQQVANVLLVMSGAALNARSMTAGSHTIKVMVLATGASGPGTGYLRAASLTEYLRIQIVEHQK